MNLRRWSVSCVPTDGPPIFICLETIPGLTDPVNWLNLRVPARTIYTVVLREPPIAFIFRWCDVGFLLLLCLLVWSKRDASSNRTARATRSDSCEMECLFWMFTVGLCGEIFRAWDILIRALNSWMVSREINCKTRSLYELILSRGCSRVLTILHFYWSYYFSEH